METICFFLLVTFGLHEVQTTLVNIYNRSYEKSMLKFYYANSPSEIKFTNSNIILFIMGKGYDVGTYDNLHRLWGMDEPYSPSTKENITDRYRNLVECEHNRLVYFSTAREMFAVHTGNSTYSVRCEADYNTNNAFIISSTTKDATKGKLYVLNTELYTVTYFWVTAQDLEEVGDRVTAVAIDPSNGDILVASETESSELGFHLILLKQLRTDLTSLSGFTDAVENAKENLNKLFKTDSKKRLDQLITEISQNTEQLPDSSSVMNTNITCENTQLQQIIDITGNGLIQLFEKIILGNEAQQQKDREIQCTNNMNKVRKEISDFSKRIKSTFRGILPSSLVSSVDITEATCLEVAKNKKESFSCSLTEKMNYKQLKYSKYYKIAQYAVEFLTTNTVSELETPTKIKILGKNYIMRDVKIYYGEAPTFIQYKQFLSSLNLFVNGNGYDIGNDFSSMRLAHWFKPSRDDSFTDKAGNVLNCSGARGVFSIQENMKSYTIFSNPNTYIVQCHADYERNRAFIIASNSSESRKGKLYVFNIKHSILNNKMNVQEIKDVGDSITAVTVRPLTGEIILSEKVTTFKERAFKMILIQPITDLKEEENKPQLNGVNDYTLILKDFEDGLLDQYYKGWKNCSNHLVNQYNLLKSKKFPIEDEDSNDGGSHDPFNDHLKEAIRNSTDRVTEIYHYNVARLDDKITEERRERIICQPTLNMFQTKIIRNIDDLFNNYNSETDGTLTDLWPEELSETTCENALTESYSCVRTDELRENRRHLLEIEKFLKNLRRLLINDLD